MGFLTALAAPSEALASCLDPTSCVCTGGSPDAAFSATVLDIDTSVEPNVAKLRIDVLKVRPGGTTALSVGGEASTTDDRAKVGAKVLGVTSFTSLMNCTDDGCTKEEVETVSLQSIFGQDGKIVCGFEDELHLSGALAIDLILDSGCRDKVNQRLEEAGADLSCNDVGCVSIAPGAPGPLSLSGAIVLGLGGLALARRRRR
jgi:hypothetical protein